MHTGSRKLEERTSSGEAGAAPCAIITGRVETAGPLHG
jgi:hypothetical protein